MAEIDMLQARLLFFQHIAIQRTPAYDIKQLRSATNSKNRQFFPERLADESDFYFILERMSFLEVLEIFRPGLVMLGLDVFALDKQKSLHVCHVLRKTRGGAFDDRHHHRQNAQPDQKR